MIEFLRNSRKSSFVIEPSTTKEAAMPLTVSRPSAESLHPRMKMPDCSAGVPFFFKQWGGVFKKRCGRELDGCTHDDIPGRSDRAMPGLIRRRELIAEVERTFSSGTEGSPADR